MGRALGCFLVALCACVGEGPDFRPLPEDEPEAPETLPEPVGPIGAVEPGDEPEDPPAEPEQGEEDDGAEIVLDVVLVQAPGAGVNADVISERLERANDVWAQAGVRFVLAHRVFEEFDQVAGFADWEAFPDVAYPAIPLYIVEDIVGGDDGHGFATGGMATKGPDRCEPIAVARYSVGWGVISHELGHLMTRGHVDDPANVMFPELNSNTELTDEQIETARRRGRLYAEDCGFGSAGN